MGILLITSTIIVIFNLVADVLYAVVDPRIRYD
jgi:ABC-type dipeptide/oligopeptide/nickel transport system permease component